MQLCAPWGVSLLLPSLNLSVIGQIGWQLGDPASSQHGRVSVSEAPPPHPGPSRGPHPVRPGSRCPVAGAQEGGGLGGLTPALRGKRSAWAPRFGRELGGGLYAAHLACTPGRL